MLLVSLGYLSEIQRCEEERGEESRGDFGTLFESTTGEPILIWFCPLKAAYTWQKHPSPLSLQHCTVLSSYHTMNLTFRRSFFCILGYVKQALCNRTEMSSQYLDDDDDHDIYHARIVCTDWYGAEFELFLCCCPILKIYIFLPLFFSPSPHLSLSLFSSFSLLPPPPPHHHHHPFLQVSSLCL